eukprot:4329465-Amphidinium_carterae.1
MRRTTTKIAIGVDSGSGVMAWPVKLCSEYGKQKSAEAGRVYAPAGSMCPAVRNEGQRVLPLISGGK